MNRFICTLLGCATTFVILIITGFSVFGVSETCGATLAIHLPLLLIGIFVSFFFGGYVSGFYQIPRKQHGWNALITSSGIWCSSLLFFLPEVPLWVLSVPISIAWAGCVVGMKRKVKKVAET